MLAVLLGLSTQLGKVPLPEFVGNKPRATTYPLQYAQAGRKKRARIDLSVLNKENRKVPLIWGAQTRAGLQQNLSTILLPDSLWGLLSFLWRCGLKKAILQLEHPVTVRDGRREGTIQSQGLAGARRGGVSKQYFI